MLTRNEGCALEFASGAALLLTVFVSWFWQAWWLGRTLARARFIPAARNPIRDQVKAEHRMYARRTFWVLPVLLGFIDGHIRVFGLGHGWTPFIMVHIFCIASPAFILTGVTAYWITGERYPKKHRRIVWWTLGFLLIAISTGLYILIPDIWQLWNR